MVFEFFSRRKDTPRESSDNFKSVEYKGKVDKILFEGNFLNKRESPLIISQTNRESSLLSKGMLLADVYFPTYNWLMPIIGKYSEDKIEAYSVGLGYVPSFRHSPLKEKLLSNELSNKNISGKFSSFQEVFSFLKKHPGYSYHLKSFEEKSWLGKTIFYGVPRLDKPFSFHYLEGELKLQEY